MTDAPRGLFAGLTTLDLIHLVDRAPGLDEKVTARTQELVAGGPAAVAALTFATLGGRSTLVTGLGSHPLAELARADLAGRGVTVRDLSQHAGAPAVSAVRVHAGTGQRSVSSPDAARGAELVAPSDLAAWVDAVDVVLLDGHHPGLALAAGSAARDACVPVVLDAGRWRPVFAALLRLTQFVVASAAFTLVGDDVGPGGVGSGGVGSGGSGSGGVGSGGVDRNGVDRNGVDPSALVGAGPEAAACSAGAGPIRWAVPGESGSVAVRPVPAGDTNGAGDVLHGAVAFAVAAVGAGPALARWPEVLSFAADVATVRVEHPGPRAWLADPRPREWGRRWTS